MRKCGECTACCKLLPMKADAYSREQVKEAAVAMVQHGLATAESFRGMMPDFTKPAGEKCPHQSHHKGCKVYERRPFGCRYWNCRWLVNNDCDDLRRPDRSHVVIDLMPDFVTFDPNDGTPRVNVEVVQMWCDPKHPDAWREPSILAYIERRAAEGIATMIRWNAEDAITVLAPVLSSDHEWHEITGRGTAEHRGPELFEGLAQCRTVKLEVS